MRLFTGNIFLPLSPSNTNTKEHQHPLINRSISIVVGPFPPTPINYQNLPLRSCPLLPPLPPLPPLPRRPSHCGRCQCPRHCCRCPCCPHCPHCPSRPSRPCPSRCHPCPRLRNPFGIPQNSAINPILDLLNSEIFIGILFFRL